MSNKKDKFGGISVKSTKKNTISATNKKKNTISAANKKKNTINYIGGKTFVIMLSVLLTVMTLFWGNHRGNFAVNDRLDVANGSNLFSAKFVNVIPETLLIFRFKLSSLTDKEIVPFITSGKMYRLEDELENFKLGTKVSVRDVAERSKYKFYRDPPIIRDQSRKIIDIEKRTRIFERVDAGESRSRILHEENLHSEDLRKLLSWRELNINQEKISNFISNFIKNNRSMDYIEKSAWELMKLFTLLDAQMMVDLINSGGYLYNTFDYVFLHAISNHPNLFAIFVFSMMLIMAGGSLIFLKIAIMVIMNMGVKKDGRFKTGKKNNYTSEKALSDGAEMTKSFIPIMLFSVKWGYLIHLFYFISLLYFYDGLAYLFPSFIIKWLMMPLIIIDI